MTKRPADTSEGHSRKSFVAFHGSTCVAAGDLRVVALKAKQVMEDSKWASVLIFDALTSELVELDLRGSERDVLARLDADASVVGRDPAESAVDRAAPRGPGRPRLGVVAREVTLLPRHWDWLNAQPGGASVALRKLVDTARRENAGKDQERQAREAAYRFMAAMAGNEPGFEEATRALFAGDRLRFRRWVKQWPADVRVHATRLAAAGLPGGADK